MYTRVGKFSGEVESLFPLIAVEFAIFLDEFERSPRSFGFSVAEEYSARL